MPRFQAVFRFPKVYELNVSNFLGWNWPPEPPEPHLISSNRDQACVYFGVISGRLLAWHQVSNARRSWVSPTRLCKRALALLRSDVRAGGRQTDRNCNNRVAGGWGEINGQGRTSVLGNKCQQRQTICRRWRTGWGKGAGEKLWFSFILIVCCLFFFNILQLPSLIRRVGCSPNWSWKGKVLSQSCLRWKQMEVSYYEGSGVTGYHNFRFECIYL